jgi:hypothetical protein
MLNKNLENEGKNGTSNTYSDSGGVDDLGSLALADYGDEIFGDLDNDGDGSALFQHLGLGAQDADHGAHGFYEELTQPEEAIVRLAKGKASGTRGRAATSASEKIYITHEDFDEGVERDAFLLIYGYASTLFSQDKIHKAADENAQEAIDFFFTKHPGRLNLDEAAQCIDTQIRSDVLRLRFMLEFWLRGWKLAPLKLTAVDLPSRMELMAARVASINGVVLTREVWFQPGIGIDDLVKQVISADSSCVAADMHRAISDLCDSYVLSHNAGKLYATGKNPIQELEDKKNDPTVSMRGKLANINWSRRF